MDSWNKFLAFESDNNLFDLKSEGIYIWDIVRLRVYSKYLHPQGPEDQSGSKRELRQILKNRMTALGGFFHLLTARRKGNKFIVLTRSRYKDNNNQYLDFSTEDIVKSIGDQSLLLEFWRLHGAAHFKYNVVLNVNDTFRLFWKRFFYRAHDYTNLEELIRKELGIDFSSAEINSIISDYKADRFYYDFVLKWIKPKMVFVVQHGVQKGLFQSAHLLNIPVVELQHGIIDVGHVLYNYSECVNDLKDKVYLPDYLFTFSDFWMENLYYPVKGALAMGNSNFYKNSVLERMVEENVLTVFSVNHFSRELIHLLKGFLQLNTEYIIYFKLHPSEIRSAGYFKEVFKDYPNIAVIVDERTTAELISISKTVLTIQSTVVYEALQNGCPVLLYKKLDYQRQEHIFNHPGVHLIDDEHQMQQLLDGNQLKLKYQNSRLFFEDFDQKAFNKFLANH